MRFTQFLSVSLTAIVLLAGLASSVHAGSRLTTGDTLLATEQLTSNNGVFTLTLQADGNLVIRRWDSVIWESGSSTSGAPRLSMQTDNNIVIYNTANWSAAWSASTWNSGAKYLSMQNDGNLVAYTANWSPVWSTNTHQSDMRDLLSGLGNEAPMQIRTADSAANCLKNFTAGGYTPLYTNVNGRRVHFAGLVQTITIAGQALSTISCNYDNALDTNWQYNPATKQIALIYKERKQRQSVPNSGVSTSEYDLLLPAGDSEAICIDVDGALAEGSTATTQLCDAFSPTQHWDYDNATKQIRSSSDPSLCLHRDSGITVEKCSSTVKTDNKWAAFAL